MRICPKCGRCFKSLQGYSKHYSLCYLAKQSSSERNNQKRKLNNESEFVMPSSEILLKPTMLHQNNKADHTNNNVTLSNMEQSNNNHSSTMASTTNDYAYSPAHVTPANVTCEPMILNSEQKSLLDQESRYQKQVAKSNLLWSNIDSAKLDLLQILQRHNCYSNSAFKDILEWQCRHQRLHLASLPSLSESNCCD